MFLSLYSINPQCPHEEQDPPEQPPHPHEDEDDGEAFELDWPCAKNVESSLLESSLWH